MKRGFTLIEILASVALLVVITLLGAGIVGSASSVSRTTIQRTALREDARAIFDRMTLDFSSAIRFDTYQFQTTAGTHAGISLLSRNGPGGNGRLRRIDYKVQTNGLFRHVRDLGWDDSQDLSSVPEGEGELLSAAVGGLAVQVLLNDGTIQPVLQNPSASGNPRPVAAVVALALADPSVRKNRNLSSPDLTATTTAPWISLPAREEAAGWRLSDKIIRLP